MASSEMRDKDLAATRDHAPAEVDGPPHAPSTPKEERARRGPGRAISAADRDRLLKDARTMEFPIGVRGYQRSAVDRYVERVNRLITELEMYSSPESAVRHALDEVSDETREILQHAHQSAEEITTRSRARADERLQQAEREAKEALAAAEQQAKEMRESAARDAQETRAIAQRESQEAREAAQRDAQATREAATRETQALRSSAQREADELLESARREAEDMLERAEARASELARSAEAMWRERRRLIDDVRAVGEQLVALGEVEGKRFARLPEELSFGEHAGNGRPVEAVSEPAATPREPAHT